MQKLETKNLGFILKENLNDAREAAENSFVEQLIISLKWKTSISGIVQH